MPKRTVISALILIFAVSLAFGYTPPKSSSNNCPITHQRDAGVNDELYWSNEVVHSYTPYLTDDIIGENWVLGTSWYDIQHNTTCGRQIHKDTEGYIHVVWMNGLQALAIDRHIYYQLVDPAGNMIFVPPTYPDMGVQVDILPRAGYTVLEIHSDNRAMPCFHQGAGGDNHFHTALSFDVFPYSGTFLVGEPPWLYYPGGEDMEVIWPKCWRDRNDRYHIVSNENPISGYVLDPRGIYYSRGTLNMMSYSIDWQTPQQQLVAHTEVIATNITASPVSDRVAIAWLMHQATDTVDTNQYDNDLILCISEDGLTWDWSDTINVTNFFAPDLELLPGALATAVDTMLADRDTIRCYDDIDLIFDSNDVLHVAFSTRGYYSIEGTLTWGNGTIYHWDEVSQEFSTIANGWYANGFYASGAWNVYTQRASMAEDPATGNIYCMYQRYLTPIDTTLPYDPDLYLWADTSDFSLGGFPNGEIWVTVSTDGGQTWAEGINITNTHSPNAAAGFCMSEITPSMAPEITDEYLHIFYIYDRDAGTPVQTEGVWTENDVIYHRVDMALIPVTPIVDFIPLHCDITMYAPTITSYSPSDTSLIGAQSGQSYNFMVQASDPGGAVYYEWILEECDSTSYANILDRQVIGNNNTITVTASAEPLPGYYQLKGRAYGVSYFNERVWYIENYRLETSSVSQDFYLNANWNLISLGVTPEDNSLSTLFPTATAAYKYTGGPSGTYQLVNTLEPGTGYWLYVPAATTRIINGAPFSSYSTPVSPPWELKGSVYDEAYATTTPAGGIVVMYWFNGSTYIMASAADPLQPDYGYWMNFASNVTQLNVTPMADADNENPVRSIDELDQIWELPITVTGETGGAPNVFTVSIGADNASSFVPAPPPPPQYMVWTDLYDENWNGPYYTMTIANTTEDYTWVLHIDPNGNVMPPISRTAVVDWDTGQLPVEGDFRIEDMSGNVIVADMRSTSSFETSGASDAYFYIIAESMSTAPEVTVILNPLNPPIVIPANGGTFEFEIGVANNSASVAVVDIWTDVLLPNGTIYGPIITAGPFTVAAGTSPTRERMQNVPAGAPSGIFYYNAYIGMYPDTVFDNNFFEFEKLAVSDGGELFADWISWGESFDGFGSEMTALAVDHYYLSKAHPNPFNPETRLNVALPEAGRISLIVYDITGREIARLMDGWYSAGYHDVAFNGAGLSSGVYFVRLNAGNIHHTQKLLLLK